MSTKTIHYQLCGLDYVYIRVPVAKAKGEEYINLPMGAIEKAIARQLIAARVPIRGAELVSLRKTFGMTLKDLAEEFGLSAAGVLKWEKGREVRLSKVNEAAVRAFAAEKLGIEIAGSWSKLVAKPDTPKRLSLTLEAA
jgi:DNA-binding transcriptional regulator YiaG